MVNVTLLNLVVVLVCIILCAGVLVYLCKEYEFNMGDEDQEMNHNE